MMRVWALMLVLVASGCVRSVAMLHAREQFAAIHQDAKTRAADALKEARQAKRLVHRLHKLVDPQQGAPMGELRQLASAMDAGAQSLKAKTRGMQRLRTRLAKLGRSQTVLRAKEAGWVSYHELRRDLGRLDRASRDAYEAFSVKPKAFKALCAKHGVGPMDTSEFGPRMAKRIKAMDALLAKASQRVADVEPLLQREGIDEQVVRRVQSAVVQLQAMTETRTEVRHTALRFRIETKTGPKAMIAPGMVTYNLFERLDHLETDMRAAGRRIDELVAGLPAQE